MDLQRERELLDKARHLYQKGQSQLALQIVRQVLQSNPTSERGWLLLAYLVRKDKQKAIYCLREVLSINPNNQEARLVLAKYQQSRKSTLPQKHEKTKGGDRMQQLVIGGVVGVVLLLSIVVGVLAISLKHSASYVQPQRPIAPITLPPTWTPQVSKKTPTPTLALVKGDPLDYVPVLPDQFEIDYSLPQGDTTLEDGTRLLTIGFKNTQAVFDGDLASVVYFISIYPNEAKAISVYRKYVNEAESSGEGTMASNIEIEGAAQSAIRIKKEGEGVFSVEFTSRAKNAIITTIGLTSYDPQEVTDEFLKSFVAKVAKVHVLGLNKLSR